MEPALLTLPEVLRDPPPPAVIRVQTIYQRWVSRGLFQKPVVIDSRTMGSSRTVWRRRGF